MSNQGKEATNPRPKPSLVHRAIVWIVFITMCYVAYSLYTTYASGEPMPESSVTEFNIDMASGKITRLNISSDGRSLTYRINGVDKTTISIQSASSIAAPLIAQGVPVYAEPPSSGGGFGGGLGFMIILSVVPVLLLIGAMFYLAKRNSNGGPMSKFGQNKAIRINPEDIKVSFEDVALSTENSTEINDLIDFLTNPEDYHRIKARAPKGILLIGPPGTGKTLLCKAIAKKANVPFFSANGAEFEEMLVGTGASRIRSLFEEAKAAGSAIIFIDEIDAIGSRSKAGSLNSTGDQTINQLLTAMDGFEDSDVTVIGATNRPEILDPALMRPGRFDRTITLNNPDPKAREKILKIHLSKVPHKVTDDAIEALAKGTAGFSGAELSKIVNEAAIYGARLKESFVTNAFLEDAKDKVMMGEASSRKMKPEDIARTAYHEAGHAILGSIMPEHNPVHKVSIVPRQLSLGVTIFSNDDDAVSLSLIQCNSNIVTLLGGRAAEELIYGKETVTTGAGNDLERATAIARSMVTRWAMSDLGLVQMVDNSNGYGPNTGYSEYTAQLIDKEIKKILDGNYQIALEKLTAYNGAMESMANELIEKETIDRERIAEIVESVG